MLAKSIFCRTLALSGTYAIEMKGAGSVSSRRRRIIYAASLSLRSVSSWERSDSKLPVEGSDSRGTRVSFSMETMRPRREGVETRFWKVERSSAEAIEIGG